MAHKSLQPGAMLVSGSDVDDAQPWSVALLVISLGFEIGTTILVVPRRRIRLNFDLLELLHDRDSVKSARSCHNQLFYVAVFQDFDN